MRAGKALLLVVLTSLAVTACEASPAPIPTRMENGPDLLRVNLDPALEWLGPALDACSVQTGGLGILLSQPADAVPADFTLQLGAPSSVSGYMAQLGEDQLVVVVNPSRTIPTLTNDEVNGLWSGLYASWSDLDIAACDTCATPASDVRVWVYPLESRLQQHILAAFGMERIAPQALIAPDPAAARQAVAGDPGAVAILPSRWVDHTVKAVPLTAMELPELLRMPILTLAGSEPQGAPREWLLCLQNVISPEGQ